MNLSTGDIETEHWQPSPSAPKHDHTTSSGNSRTAIFSGPMILAARVLDGWLGASWPSGKKLGAACYSDQHRAGRRFGVLNAVRGLQVIRFTIGV